MRSVSWNFALCLMCSALALSAVAQAPDEAAKEDGFKVTVVDEDGVPIPAAMIAITGWEDGSDRNVAVPMAYKSVQADGSIRLAFPKEAKQGRLAVKAYGYSPKNESFTLSDELTVTLKEGREVLVRAVDEDGEVFPDAFPLLEDSRVFGREFKADIDHWILTGVAKERNFMRVVGVGDSGELHFSDLINVDLPDAAGEDGIIEAVLKPGLKVVGRLDESVPRPVKNGLVEICIVEATDHRIPRSTKPRNEEYDQSGFKWDQTVPLQEDGTFEIESLPAGGHLQLFALTDGYQSKIPTIDELASYLKKHDAGGEETLEWAERRTIRSQLFPLKDQDGDGVVHINVPCSPTTKLTVKVVTPDNKPIEGANLRLNPNGIFLMGGLFIPGTEWMTKDRMVRQKGFVVGEKNKIRAWVDATLLSPTTNEDGVAHVNFPGIGRGSFEVKANGYVMPLHPLARSPEQNRDATVELVPGQTLHRTITMEREIPTTERAVLVVDEKGKPLPDIVLTALEVEFEGNVDEWHYWSVQRYGSIAKATTSSQGKAVLRVPTFIEQRPVTRYRVHVEGRLERGAKPSGDRRKAYVRGPVTVPLSDDGGVIAVSISKDAPAKKFAYWQATPTYADPSSLSSGSGQEMVQQMVKQPTLVLLKQLLAMNNYDASVPLSLDGEFNRLAGWKNKSPVAVVDCGKDKRVVVLCEVRPQGATWTTKPEGRFPPDVAFIFNESDGKLIAAIGGGQSSRGSYDHVALANLGGGDDVFVTVNRFEKRDVNGQGTRWYRLARAELGPSLSIEHDGNSTTHWSADAKNPVEFGYVGFGLKGKKLADTELGETRDGTKTNRKIYWDSKQNRFLGIPQQFVDGKSIYRVIQHQSEEFTNFEPSKRDIVVAGGRYDYESWYMFEVAVPAERKATLALRAITDVDGKRSEKILASIVLKSGQLNSLNFQVDPKKQTDDTSLFRLTVIEENQKQEFTIPRVSIDDTPSVPGDRVMRGGEDSVPVWVRRSSVGETETIVELIVQGE